MSLTGLQYQPLQIPFSAGLNTKGDPRTQQPPLLDICDDVMFDNIGGLQTRYPFAGFGANILGGGTLSNVRRIYQYGDEFLCFTSDTLYSWNAQQSVWVSRGTHLAVAVDEQTVFGTNDDQQTPDRAELNNTIVYAWSNGTRVYVAALDKTTGSVVMSPTAPNGGGGASISTRPRLVALTTVILLTAVDTSGNLVAFAIDPASPSIGIAAAPTTVLGTANFNAYYDICKQPGADTAVVGMRGAGSNYYIGKVTSALAVTTSAKARTCDGPIAVSCEPTGTSVQVIRGNGTNIQGDLITISSLADVFTAQAVGTTSTAIIQISAAHRSVQNSAHYRCYAFWQCGANDGSWLAPDEVKSNWVDDGNNLGTQGTFQPFMGCASRAFDYNGQVYFWSVFNTSGDTEGFLQPTYFLFRDDGRLCAKSRTGNPYLVNTVGCLPNVALVSGSTSFAWCGVFQRAVVGGFRARAPRDITFTFDSNSARRVAQFGQTLYIATGEGVMQYDGVQITEVGFHTGPYRFDVTDAGAGGTLSAGSYTWKNTLRWLNGKGEVDRSTSFGEATLTGLAASHKMQLDATLLGNCIWSTHKTNITNEVWRTPANPTSDTPYYLVSSNDPSASMPNGYLSNSLSSRLLVQFKDDMADAIALTKEENPENGSVLEPIAPPPCKIIFATQDRIFISGIAGSPDSVWYSKTRSVGQVAQFNDFLTFEVPKAGGDITALGFLEGAIVVWRETATYIFGGGGFDNAGGGSNYALARTISTETGAVSPEAIALEDRGYVVKTNKGWHILDKSFTYQNIGEPVQLYDAETVYAVHVMTTKHQIRILTSARMLVLDTLVNQWARWTVSDGVHACLWNGTYAYLASTGPKTEQSTYTGLTYGMDVETSWIKLNDLQGRGYVRWLEILGEYRSAHSLRVRIGRDYEQDGAGNWTYYDDETWTVTPTTVGSAEQVRHGPSRPSCQAIKVRLTALATDKVSVPSGEALRLTGIALDVGLEAGMFGNLAAGQKQ